MMDDPATAEEYEKIIFQKLRFCAASKTTMAK